jgi:histidinol-phosphate aminotransferase
MIYRRNFIGVLATAIGSSVVRASALDEMSAEAFANRVFNYSAEVLDPEPLWLNANEYPEGPPVASVAAMNATLGQSNRYHYSEFDAFYRSLAENLRLGSDNLLLGAGSSEVLHCAVEAFVTRDQPFITSWPSFEMGAELAAAKGYQVIKIPLTSQYAADVRALAAAASRAGGGLIYICNPNNPTSSVTLPRDIKWLVDNLPARTNLLIDEAYIHFAAASESDTAMDLLARGRNIMVLRTFSKIYGMAGLRIGFVAATPELIKRMMPYRNNVISIVSVRAVQAALQVGAKLISQRRDYIRRNRDEFVAWCSRNRIKYIEPNANFIMIDTQRDVRNVVSKLVARGVVPGRPFPVYETMLRVTIGSADEMAKFTNIFADVLAS